MGGLTYLVLGPIDSAPANGALSAFPRSAANAGALYRARCAAVQSVTTEFFCLLDGADDVLLPGFEPSIDARLAALAESGASIAYADEYQGDKPMASGPFSLAGHLANPLMIHHAPVCRTAAAQAIDWPAGCHWFEAVCYGTLAQQGAIYLPGPVYQWNPSANGARLWPDTKRAMVNSLQWLHGLPCTHFAKDFKD